MRWRGREGRWDDVVGLGWCVVVRDADPADLLRPDQLRALEAIGVRVVGLASGRGGDRRVVDVEGRFNAFLKAHGAAAMVTRPDFYVFGGVSEAGGLAALVDEFLAALAASGVRVSAEAERAAA